MNCLLTSSPQLVDLLLPICFCCYFNILDKQLACGQNCSSAVLIVFFFHFSYKLLNKIQEHKKGTRGD